MKRVICLSLAVLLALLCVGCGGKDPVAESTAGDTTTATAAETGPVTEPETDNGAGTPETLTIGGEPLDGFRIVYAANPMTATYEKYPSLVTQDTDYNRQTAEYLAARLKEVFGVELPVSLDTATEKSAKEICVGETNREVDAASFSGMNSDKDYVIRVMNRTGRLHLMGATFGATYQSVDVLLNAVLAQNVRAAELPAGYVQKGKANLLTVACVGDSLTYGSKGGRSNVSDADRNAVVPYPAVLQRLEWKTMSVYNFGHGGRTMIEDFMVEGEGSRSYCDSPQYTKLLSHKEPFDLIILMLGTNDGNPTRATATGYTIGSESFRQKFLSSCDHLLTAFREKSPQAKIVLLNAPPSYVAAWEEQLSAYVRHYQEQAAEQFGMTLCDFHAFLVENLRGGYYPDSVHPNDEGYTVFAEGVQQLIRPTVEKLLQPEA